jgi:hypothetical protein
LVTSGSIADVARCAGLAVGVSADAAMAGANIEIAHTYRQRARRCWDNKRYIAAAKMKYAAAVINPWNGIVNTQNMNVAADMSRTLDWLN